jgi:site-specific DNA-methyltransferase (adenine-specific)
MWIYGSGFPKSHDVSKAIDKQAGAEREVLGRNPNSRENATKDNTLYESGTVGKTDYITKATTDEAKQWEGWGTALKPAHEPMVLARKPLTGTVAANVLTYGTGGLNIDGARVASGDNFDGLVGRPIQKLATQLNDETDEEYKARVLESPGQQAALAKLKELGRWPANVIHDGSDEVVALFPDKAGGGHWSKTKVTGYGEFGGGKSEYFGQGEKDGFGSAARFFYCAKASKRDRNEGLDGFEVKQTLGVGGLTEVGGAYVSIKAAGQNHHPTVKPTDLMRYLCRLITPPNGIVLDLFMGSGSTGKAAMYEGFKFIGVEMTDEYLPIAKARIEFAVSDNEGFLL